MTLPEHLEKSAGSLSKFGWPSHVGLILRATQRIRRLEAQVRNLKEASDDV